MEIRNTKRNHFGGIDTEIDHPKFGWVPFTVNKSPKTEIEASVLESVSKLQDSDISDYAETKEEKEQAIKAIRDSDLQNIEHTFSDNRTVQVRPQDLSNFSMAIMRGDSEKWIMLDNSISLLTISDMQEALSSGIDQDALIWRECTNALEAL
jgi:hypothetical protein